MTTPTMLLGLAVTIHPDHDMARREQLARLAGRLGYREVWLAAATPPPVAELAALAAAAAPARLGLALPSLPPAFRHTLPELLFQADDADPDALPGRVRQHKVHPAAAGVTVTAPTRAELARNLTEAKQARAAAGLAPPAFPVVAEVPVAIGRTMQEAEARAARDPRFAGDGHPRERGLFGTYEHGQDQVLALALAGADLLLVTLADELDVADLLAQVRALVVGATPVLRERLG